MIRKFINGGNIFFILAVILAVQKPKYEIESYIPYLVVLIVFELFHLKKTFIDKYDGNPHDMYALIFLFAFLWDLEAKYIQVIHWTMLPPPENVFYVFTKDYKSMAEGTVHSVGLIAEGVISGMVLGILCGLIIGWYKRTRDSITPIVNVIAAVPALVYAPYLVAVMPTFRVASISMIFVGIYLPTLMNMISNVKNVDQKMIDSARSLNLSTFSLLFKIILPDCAIPILSSLRIRIADAFMILTMAETVGSDVGLGYYVKRWSSFAEYDKVFAGIILIGVVVSIINALIKLFEDHALKWNKA